jgi:hypothetical protein
MSDIQTDPTTAMRLQAQTDIPLISDDECLMRLARAVEQHDSDALDEVARLIGRLAVTIE